MKKLFCQYLFFGFLLCLASLNKVWRNPKNKTLFDPRDRKYFVLDLLMWPLRLWLSLKGQVSIRMYGDKPLRAFSEQEQELLQQYTRSLGTLSIHGFFRQRNINIRRSFISSLVIFISFSIVSSAQRGGDMVVHQQCFVVEVVNDVPPDVSVDVDIGSNIFINYHKYYSILDITYFIFLSFCENRVQYFILFVFKEQIFGGVPWNPPKRREIILF